MKRLFLSLLGCCLSVLALAQQPQSYYENLKMPGLQRPEDALSFLVVGDWGRNGHMGQQAVADRMDEVGYMLGSEFIISVGDNFYDNGVRSVEDPQWQSSFEQVYKGPHHLVEWYAILGNHDYRGSVQAQIDYSQKSRRWHMPSRYYAVEKPLEDKSKQKVLLVFIDTNPMEKAYHKSAAAYGDLAAQDTAAQLRWLDKTLAESDARWKIVVGHHPLYSSGKRFGKTADIQQALEGILQRNKVDAYFCGHEHDLQHNQPEGIFTQHFVSGAGSEYRPTGKQVFTKFSAATHGFMAVSATHGHLLVQVINHKGKVIYQHDIQKTASNL